MNARRIGEAAAPLLAVVIAVVAPLALADRLPDPVAIHWGRGGVPDGMLGRTNDVVLMAAMIAIAALLPLAAAYRARARRAAQAGVATANALAGLLGGVRIISLRANVDAPSWQEAGTVGGRHMLATAAVAAALAAWGWWLAGDRPDEPTARRPLAAAALSPGEAVVWTGGAAAPLALGLPTLLAASSAAAWWLVPSEAVVPAVGGLLLATLLAAALTRVAVTIGPRAVRVRMGWVGVPRFTVPVTDIADVELEDVEPMRYGGWGLRIVPGARAVVVRRGEGLRIARRGRADLVVTVDGAEEAGSILLAHLREASDA